MPWKRKTTETRQRVRENQRRSRARRHDLLRDLQQRLDEQERLGVQATIEMQQAAGQVARENARLRDLLLRLGVSDGEVEEFLRRGDPNSVENPLIENGLAEGAGAPGSAPGVSSATELLGAEQLGTPACSYDLQAASGFPSCSEEENSYFLQPSRAPPGDRTATLWPDSTEDAQPHHANLDVSHESGLETSCEVAAAILADMHGHGDASRARVVLGCTDQSDCTVKNTTVFDLLDKAG
ncbi:hypothetical protein NKR19_g5415 [Coniochaeta hoffmannii]|uniref:BZIP domain-containing protein n=1 Tax=Coniochaeta hoffmannii TaxID=91930 RepID=A0AA38VSU4_9PEZI|nr:hypothetical protein NKR19_g5415 [Coniochaeta hoffmannii]